MISTVVTTTTISNDQIMTYSIVAVVALIAFLALKEIMSSETGNPQIKSFVKGTNVAIIPLLLVFMAIVGFKIIQIIKPF